VLIDISSSVHSCNYYKVRRFVVKITEEFQVGGANNSHFAMIHCSTYPHLDFHLNDKKFWDPIEFEQLQAGVSDNVLISFEQLQAGV